MLRECSLSRSLLRYFILSPLFSNFQHSLLFGFVEVTEAFRREHSPSLPCTYLSVSVPIRGAFPWPVGGPPLQPAKPERTGLRSHPLTHAQGRVDHSQLSLLWPPSFASGLDHSHKCTDVILFLSPVRKTAKPKTPLTPLLPLVLSITFLPFIANSFIFPFFPPSY